MRYAFPTLIAALVAAPFAQAAETLLVEDAFASAEGIIKTFSDTNNRLQGAVHLAAAMTPEEVLIAHILGELKKEGWTDANALAPLSDGELASLPSALSRNLLNNRRKNTPAYLIPVSVSGRKLMIDYYERNKAPGDSTFDAAAKAFACLFVNINGRLSVCTLVEGADMNTMNFGPLDEVIAMMRAR